MSNHQTSAIKHGKPGHNWAGSETGGGEIQLVALADLDWWAPAKEQADDVPASTIADEIIIFADGGQREAVPVRLTANGRMEVIAKVAIAEAVMEHAALNPEKNVKLKVRVFAFDDAKALRLLSQDISPAHQASSLAQGQFFARTLVEFKSLAAVAKACCVSKAAVSKNLDVVEAAKIIGDKVTILRDISQRDAIWLMGIMRTGQPSQAEQAAIIDALNAMSYTDAKTVFRLLKVAVKAASPSSKKINKNRLPLSDGKQEIGTVILKRGKIKSIDFGDDVDGLEATQVGKLVASAFAANRRNRTG